MKEFIMIVSTMNELDLSQLQDQISRLAKSEI